MRHVVQAAVLLGLFAATLAGQASAEVIDFDDLVGGFGPPPALPAGASPFATFSTEPGAGLYVFTGAGVVGTSAPNNLAASFTPDTGPFDADIYVDFVAPVSDLMLLIGADNDSGAIAKLNVYESGSLTEEIVITGNGDFSDPIPVDLSAYEDVTRIELVDITDTDGLAIDDITFNDLVPEPATLVTLLAVCGASACRRRR